MLHSLKLILGMKLLFPFVVKLTGQSGLFLSQETQVFSVVAGTLVGSLSFVEGTLFLMLDLLELHLVVLDVGPQLLDFI